MFAAPVGCIFETSHSFECFLLYYIVCIAEIVPDCLSKLCDSSGVFYVLIQQELPSILLG